MLYSRRRRDVIVADPQHSLPLIALSNFDLDLSGLVAISEPSLTTPAMSPTPDSPSAPGLMDEPRQQAARADRPDEERQQKKATARCLTPSAAAGGAAASMEPCPQQAGSEEVPSSKLKTRLRLWELKRQADLPWNNGCAFDDLFGDDCPSPTAFIQSVWEF